MDSVPLPFGHGRWCWSGGRQLTIAGLMTTRSNDFPGHLPGIVSSPAVNFGGGSLATSRGCLWNVSRLTDASSRRFSIAGARPVRAMEFARFRGPACRGTALPSS